MIHRSTWARGATVAATLALLLLACGGTTSGASCPGSAPLCFGANAGHCCGNDPAGDATCTNGKWMCGPTAEAPGCNGTSCSLAQQDAGGDAAGDGGGDGAQTVDCAGPRPLCFGGNALQCCGNDPAGDAECRSGQWMCGTALAPGCNGTSCLATDAGGD